MKKHLLIFSWEYYGYHSVQGTALSKRPRHVAESFNANGWEVTVVHKDQANESQDKLYNKAKETNGVTRIAVKQSREIDYVNKNPIIRQLETIYYIAFRGDRTYEWAGDVINSFSDFGIAKPDLIISFFTPRVTLYLGNYFSKKLGCPWIADLQDPIYEGIAKKSWPACRRWMKRILGTAKAVVHISPEWAATDAKRMGRDIYTIRHAVPESTAPKIEAAPLIEIDKNSFNVFYGGSIDHNIQSLEMLRTVIKSVEATANIHVWLAGNEHAYKYFKQELGDKVVKYLGWLSAGVMQQYIAQCDCTLVIPWSKERVGIPSKFYELCSYGKPIWIIGDDLGAFKSLLVEWQHPAIGIDNLYYQKQALKAAIGHDHQYLFDLKNCKAKYLKPADLYQEYMKLV